MGGRESVHTKLGACTIWGGGGGGGRESAHRESAHTKLGECTT